MKNYISTRPKRIVTKFFSIFNSSFSIFYLSAKSHKKCFGNSGILYLFNILISIA